MTNPDKLFPATMMPDKDWWQALWPDPVETLRKLGFAKGMSAIDLCCGDGHFTAPMSALLEGQVVGVDLDPDMLSLAKIAVHDAGAPDCPFIEGDACDLKSLVRDKVDVVMVANTFHGVPDKTELAKGVAQVLKPEGRFIIVNWHAYPREGTPVLGEPRGPRTQMRMTPDDVCEVVEPAGFECVDVIELPPYHYGAVFRLRAQD